MYEDLAIFSGTANPGLAREIADYLGRPLRGVDIFKFPNDNTFVRLHSSVRGQHSFIIQPTCAPANDNLMELLILIDALRRDSAADISAVVTYYGYSRTDKKDQPRVPITARLVADMITVAGATRFVTMNLHAGQIQGFFTIPVDDISSFHMLSEHFIQKHIEDAVVVAPDVGATKIGRDFAASLDVPLAIIEKRRERRKGTKTEVLSLIGKVEGMNAIIFDDEIDTAGTVRDAAQFLKSKGARDVYACVTHAILSHPGPERLNESGLRELVVTNTVAISEEKMQKMKDLKVTVLSVAPLLGEVIRRIYLGISVGEMFNE
ncbi:MAG: ribose-phosphate pyrophosphokinase [Anaerolineae bacterium]|nr:ribose-phosphate pyrophosphokinase [Anaerolineae bacterium]